MKKSRLCTILSVTIMLGLPWAAVTFSRGDAGIAICFLLFFAVDPVYAIGMGFFSGQDICRLWYQPLVTSLCFLAGVWLMFDMGEPAFFRYALVYLLLGMGAMGICAWKNR